MAPPKAAALIWRDFVDPLNALQGFWKPDKAEIRTWASWVEAGIDASSTSIAALLTADTAIRSRLSALELSLGTGNVTRPTYAEIAALTLSPTVTYEALDGDTGTHTGTAQDVGYNSTTGKTPNAGRYNAVGTAPYTLRRVDDTIATASAKRLAAGIVPTTADKLASLLFLALDPATGLIVDATAADFKSFIQGLSMELPTYSSEPPGLTADLTSKAILPPDDQRKNFQVQCETHDLAVNWSGRAASFERDAIVYAGVIPDWSAKGKEAVSVIARPASLRTINASTPAKVWISQDRLVPGYISGSLFADTVLSNYPDQGLNKAYRAVLRDQINQLNDGGYWDPLSIFTVPIHVRDNLILNLANPSMPMTLVEPTASTKMVVVPYKSIASGGDSFLRTGLLTAAALKIANDSHFFALQVDTNASFESGLGVAGNAAQLLIKPNSASGKAGVRSGGSANLAIDAANTAWLAMNRVAADTYASYVETAPTTQTQTLAVADREFTICAVNTASATTPTASNQKLRGLALGRGFTAASSALAVRTAMKAIFAAADVAAAA